MKKTLLILSFVLVSIVSFAQRQRTTAVFDSDTTTRPKAGFYGIGVRASNVYLVPQTGNNIRLANYSLFTGLTTNYLTKWNGSKLVNSQLSEAGGFLNSYIPNLIISGTNPTVYLNGTQANGTHIHLRNFVGGVSNSGFEIYDNTNSASRLVISGSGNVGVGTTTPNRRLVVNGDFGFSYSDGNSYAGIRQNLSGGHFGVEFFNVISSSATNRAFSFLDYTLNPIMSLLNGGNVGIGTTSPQQKTHINTSIDGVPVGLYLTNDATNATLGRGVGVLFGGTGNTNLAQIEAQTMTASNNTGGLVFKTANAGTLTEVLRVDESGRLGLGTSLLTGYNFRISKNITGGTVGYSHLNQGNVASDVTNTAIVNGTYTGTVAAAFSLGSLYHFYGSQNVIGAGSSVTNQYGFYADASMVGATNNYGFYGNIPSGNSRWNLFMSGSAQNYLNGALLIGYGANISDRNLFVAKNITGGTSAFNVVTSGVVQSDVTNAAYGFYNQASTAASAFTLGNYIHYIATQATLGAGSAITTQEGFSAGSTLIGATNNRGFRGSIPSGTNRYNLYMDGSARNFLAGQTGIGTESPDASALLHISSTTQGVLITRGTTTQINAIASPANGLMVYNTTLNKLCVYENGTWKQVTTTNM